MKSSISKLVGMEPVVLHLSYKQNKKKEKRKERKTCIFPFPLISRISKLVSMEPVVLATHDVVINKKEKKRKENLYFPFLFNFTHF